MIADLDFERVQRRGFPEAVYCQGKTAQQCAEIAAQWRQHCKGASHRAAVLFTKADEQRARAILGELPDAKHFPDAQMLAWPPEEPAPSGGTVVVACAGTSDLLIANEAAVTARYLGRRVEQIVDAGVAGLHRIIGHLDTLRSADVIVVAAGMDGALPSVVAGLVACPVVALPTSVGYGVARDGLAALLSMLSSCSPGVGVVNIDNGYGAGYLAAQISAREGQTNA